MSIAIAQPNIALVKYWGKVDEELIIPATDSLSVTLNGFPTTTEVTLNDAGRHFATLGGRELEPAQMGRINRVLDRARELSGSEAYASVRSTNTIATAAGLASSAAGFAALAKAASAAYELALTDTAVSRLARIGSGSASRSVFGGMVHWHRGTSDDTSFAEPVEWSGDALGVIILQVSGAAKALSSREGMTRTVATSPFYEGWVRSNQQLISRALDAVSAGDVHELGRITELSTMRMHASMLGAEPPIRYLTGESFSLIDTVHRLRADGMTAYTTADAGPNIKVLTTQAEMAQLAEAIGQAAPGLDILTSTLGRGAYTVEGALP